MASQADSRVLAPDSISVWSREGQQILQSCSEVLSLSSFFGADDRADCDGEIQCDDATPVSAPVDSNIEGTASKYCSLCLVAFSSRDDQVEHFRCEWHVTNLRRRLRKKPCLTEQEFEDIVAGDNSDSDQEADRVSDSDDELSASSSTTHILLNNHFHPRTKVYFNTNQNHVYCIHRCNLVDTKDIDQDSLLSQLKEVRLAKVWTILLLSGGRFAGGVFDGSEVVVHKTFHSYTTRRKQGGAQSARDGAQSGRAPRSAGASLRRYNEAALQDHIRNLLADWKSEIQRCQKIFLRCSSYHRIIFFGGKDPILAKSDPRISSVPIITRRPIFAEIKRVQKKLSNIEDCGTASTFTETIRLAANQLLVKKNETRAKPAAKRVSPLRRSSSSGPPAASALAITEEKADSDDGSPSLRSVTVDDIRRMKRQIRRSRTKNATNSCINKEDADADHLALSQDLRARVYTACRSGDFDALQLTVNEIKNANLTKADDEKEVPGPVGEVPRIDGSTALLHYLNGQFGPEQQTFLHVAASEGHGAVLRLLLELGANPCLKNNKGQVPYQVCAAKPIRRMFSRFRAENAEKWDWKQAQIPEPLDPLIEAEQQAKLSAKRKEAKKLRNERLKEKKAEERKIQTEEAEKTKFLNLSDREKRALAAERRILNQAKENEVSLPILSRCFECGVDISGLVPFEYCSNVFCSTNCLKFHRRKCSSAGEGR